MDPAAMTDVPEPGTPEHDAVEEALTDMWMANSLCLTFLVLNSIGFACAVFAAPVIARGFEAQQMELSGLLQLLLGFGFALRAAWPVTLAIYAGLQLGAVVTNFAWSSRKGKIKLFFYAACIPLTMTFVTCLAALAAAF
jgi:hypothetical protein